MPVKNKNRQSNSGYEGVITGLNDEEKKVLEDAGIGGGDIWLNISPYVDGETMTISQEGYDLVWNSFSNYADSPINKYAGIDVDGSQKFFFDKSILSDIGGKQGLGFIHKINIDGAEGCSFLNIYEDKSVEFDSKGFDNNLTLPSTTPTSQLIPSITTTNTQQNLTIGDGLTIENGALKATGSGGGGKSVPPTLNLFDFKTHAVRTTITEEEYNNLKNGLYNQVVYAISGNNFFPVYSPSKLFNIGGECGFTQFKIVVNADGMPSYSFMNVYLITIGEKNTSNEYPITITEALEINPPSADGGGSSKVWYELPSLFFLENITQEQFDEIKNLVLQNQLAGINCAGLYCPLTFYNDGRNIDFFYPWYENDIFTSYIVRLNADLSVKKIPYSTITLPQTAPTSQLIPSITTSNKQQNLTIGNGLEIKNGALQATIPPLPADASTKTYTLKAVNGVLTWVEG